MDELTIPHRLTTFDFWRILSARPILKDRAHQFASDQMYYNRELTNHEDLFAYSCWYDSVLHDYGPTSTSTDLVNRIAETRYNDPLDVDFLMKLLSNEAHISLGEHRGFVYRLRPSPRALTATCMSTQILRQEEDTDVRAPTLTKQEYHDIDIYTIPIIWQEEDTGMYTPTPIKQEEDTEVNTPSPIWQEGDIDVSTPSSIKQEEDLYVYTPTPINQEEDTEVNTPSPIWQEGDIDVSTPSSIKQEEESDAYTPSPINQEEDTDGPSPTSIKQEEQDTDIHTTPTPEELDAQFYAGVDVGTVLPKMFLGLNDISFRSMKLETERPPRDSSSLIGRLSDATGFVFFQLGILECADDTQWVERNQGILPSNPVVWEPTNYVVAVQINEKSEAEDVWLISKDKCRNTTVANGSRELLPSDKAYNKCRAAARIAKSLTDLGEFTEINIPDPGTKDVISWMELVPTLLVCEKERQVIIRQYLPRFVSSESSTSPDSYGSAAGTTDVDSDADIKQEPADENSNAVETTDVYIKQESEDENSNIVETTEVDVKQESEDENYNAVESSDVVIKQEPEDEDKSVTDTPNVDIDQERDSRKMRDRQAVRMIWGA